MEGEYVGITIPARKLRIQKNHNRRIRVTSNTLGNNQCSKPVFRNYFFFSVFKRFGFQAKLRLSSRYYMYYHTVVTHVFHPLGVYVPKVSTRSQSVGVVKGKTAVKHVQFRCAFN